MSAARTIILILLAAAISLLAACSGGTTFNVKNPVPPATQQPVSISFTTTPPTGINLAPATFPTVSATVTNDPDNDGVTWELVGCTLAGNCSQAMCTISASGTAPCGRLVNSTGQQVAHSSSGQVLSYQPPSTFPVPGNALTVDIIALSTYDNTKNVTAPITITAYGSVLKGSYIFQVQGSDSTVSTYPYQLAGVVYLDGSGNLAAPSGGSAAGQQTINTYDLVTGNLASTTSQITGGSYFIGADGRGSLIVNTTDAEGDTVVEDFSIVVISSAEAQIAEVAGTNSFNSTTALTQSGSGTLELQDATAAATLPTGGIAFVTSGTDTLVDFDDFGGVLNTDSSGNIQESQSIVNQIYYPASNGNVGDIICGPPNGLTGTISLAQSTGIPGIVNLNLTASTPNSTGGCFNSTPGTNVNVSFLGYIVDANHFRMIETDVNATAGTGFLTAGIAMPQLSPSGQSLAETFANASFSGPYVFDALGLAPIAGVIPSSFTSVGVICPDGGGGLDGCTDASGSSSGGWMDATLFSDNVFCPTCSAGPFSISAEITNTGTYHIDSHGFGRITTAPQLRPQPYPTQPFGPQALFFLTGCPPAPPSGQLPNCPAQSSGAPALVMLTGGGGPTYPALGVGIAYPQVSNIQSVSFSGSFGLRFAQTNGSENDGSGQLAASVPAGTTTGTLSGTIDDSFNNFVLAPAAPPLAVTDSFTCASATGCGNTFGLFPGTFTTGALTGALADYYLIDATTNANNQLVANHGFFVETDTVNTSALTLGFFAQNCDVTGSDTTRPCGATSSNSARQRVSNKLGSRGSRNAGPQSTKSPTR